jgi:hypothetical protein
MLKSLPVHMLWVSGELSRLARLSLASFLARGFRVTLWSYAPEDHDGSGAVVRDAGDVLPMGHDEEGSFAYLSSLFRYRLLSTEGGVWSDMDVVALGDGASLPAKAFVASAKRRPFRAKEATATGESLTQVSNCFMANPKPKPHDLWARATDQVAVLNPEERSWENVGPPLLSKLMLDDPEHGVAILPPEMVDPVAWWNVPAYFLEAREPPPSPFMHMYASIWAKRGVDAEAPFPEQSLAGKLWRAYGL